MPGITHTAPRQSLFSGVNSLLVVGEPPQKTRPWHLPVRVDFLAIWLEHIGMSFPEGGSIWNPATNAIIRNAWGRSTLGFQTPSCIWSFTRLQVWWSLQWNTLPIPVSQDSSFRLIKFSLKLGGLFYYPPFGTITPNTGRGWSGAVLTLYLYVIVSLDGCSWPDFGSEIFNTLALGTI